MKQERLIKFTNYLLGFMFYAGFVVILALPFILKLAGKYVSSSFEKQYFPMLIIYGVAGLCALIILHRLRQMIKTVIKQDCFVHGNVRNLKIMGKLSYIISTLFFIKLFFHPTAATWVIILTFFVAGIFSHALACVFYEAVRCKEENDLTI